MSRFYMSPLQGFGNFASFFIIGLAPYGYVAHFGFLDNGHLAFKSMLNPSV